MTSPQMFQESGAFSPVFSPHYSPTKEIASKDYFQSPQRYAFTRSQSPILKIPQETHAKKKKLSEKTGEISEGLWNPTEA